MCRGGALPVQQSRTPLIRRNTFQLAMGSDGDGRTFATICYDNIVWLVGGTATPALTLITNGQGGFVSLVGASTAAMTCGGSSGTANGA